MANHNGEADKKYLDPFHLTGNAAFFITRPDGSQEGILMPGIMPDTYEASRQYLVRLAIASHDKSKYDDTYLTPASEQEEALFMVHEYKTERESAQAGRKYQNRYDAIIAAADMALSRGMDEQGLTSLATVHDLSAIRSLQQQDRERLPLANAL